MHPSHLSRNLKKVGIYTCHLPISPHVRKLLGPEWALAPDFLTILDFSVVKFPHTYGTYIYVLSANSCLPGDPKWRSPKGDSPKGDSPKGDSPKGDLAHIVSSLHQTSSRSATTKSHLVPARGNVHRSHLSPDLKKVGKYTCHLSTAPHVRNFLGPEWALAPDFLTILDDS